MPETIVHVPIRAAGSINELEGVRVFLRERWSGAWVEEPFLFCDSVTFASSPDISHAEFEWRYGEGMRQGEAVFSTIPYRRLNRYWVKVEIDQFDEDGELLDDPLIWVGIIEEDGDNVFGSLGGDPHGIQKILAHGPESLLESEIVDRMACFSDGEERVVHAAEPFNRDIRQSSQAADKLVKKEYKNRVGNRSANTTDGEGGTYLFADYLEFADGTTQLWDAESLVEYLLKYFSPRDSMGSVVVQFQLIGDGSTIYLPTGGLQEIKAQGRSVKDILDEVMDRRRLLGYAVEIDPDDSQRIAVRPFTYLDQTIDLPEEDLVLVSNEDLLVLIVDDCAAVEQLHVKESTLHNYDRVVAAGAPMVACGTFSWSSSLDKFWAVDEEIDYQDAATGIDDYNTFDIDKKQQLNDLARSSEKFSRVWTAFCLPRERWHTCGDDFIEDGLADIILDEFFDEMRLTDPFVVYDWMYYPTCKILPLLPLRSDHDYRENKIENDLIDHVTPPEGEWRYLEPLVILNVRDPDGEQNLFQNLADTGAISRIEHQETPGLEFSCSIHIPQDGNYFQLRVEGEHHHFLAKDHYVPPTTLGYEEEELRYDWQKDLLATLAVEFPPVQAQWPRNVTGDIEFVRTLRIDASDWAALHYVAPHTVVAIENGQLIRTEEGGLIRDDRAFLRRIARLAFEWYGKRRQAMTLTYRGATPICKVGHLITTLGTGASEEPIRTVVTEVKIDFAQNANDTHKTTIQTQWAEMDVLRMIL